MPEYEVYVDTDPDPRDLVRELREALGLFAGAMPISPKEAWDEAIEVVRRLAGKRPIDQFFDEFDPELNDGCQGSAKPDQSDGSGGADG